MIEDDNIKFNNPKEFSLEMFELIDDIKLRMNEEHSNLSQIDVLDLILNIINKYKK